MATQISYSDFLREDILQKKKVVSPIEESKKVVFRLNPGEVATDAEEKKFWQRLRHFFRTGERPEGRNGIFIPALIAPYLRHGNWETEYPFYLAQETSTSQSLEKLLHKTCDEIFEENEARILRKFIPNLFLYYKQNITGPAMEFTEVSEKAFEKFFKLDIHDEDGERFRRDAVKLKEALPRKGLVFDFHPEVPLLLFNQILQQIEWNRHRFKAMLKEKRHALAEKLAAESDLPATETRDTGFAFASDMIALDKVRDMMPKKGRSGIAEDRLERIRGILLHLDEAVETHENRAHILISEKMKTEYRWNEIFTSSRLTFSGQEEAISLAQKIFDRNIGAFTRALIASRKADLELENAYNAQVHDDFYNHFKWFKLTEKELSLFPPVLLFTQSADLTESGMSSLSKLLSANKPVKIIAFMNRTVQPTNPNVDWEDAALGYRQELASAALAHRNVHTLQCTSDKPSDLLNGIRSGISSTSPALMHVLVAREEEESRISFLKINAAAEGRYFPFLMYDPAKGRNWGSRFDISGNAQTENDWPVYPFRYMSADNTEQEMNLAFTYADYKAMNRAKVEELFLVPETMVNDFLVPLHQFLTLTHEEQTGKVPFIWLIDESNRMVRAAVPYMWVSSCLERLDFWNFIQELGGVHNYHVQVVLQKAEEQWIQKLQEEREALKRLHEEEMRKAKREAAGEAMDKLTLVLLNLDQIDLKPSYPESSVRGSTIVPDREDVIQETAPPVTETAEEESSEAWIETFRCTSCNDCINKYPFIFAYNEDKQAFVKDASKGTFEQLVLAAENCPAACIHPGKPRNSNEPNLQELLQRAAKFI